MVHEDEAGEGEAVVVPRPRAHAREKVLARGVRDASGLALVWLQLEHAEALASSLSSRMQATAILMATWEITRRRARALQAAVAKRLRMDREESQRETREERLERYRYALQQQVSLATAEGDRRAAIAALAVLVKMEGETPAPKLPAGRGILDASGNAITTDAELYAIARRGA